MVNHIADKLIYQMWFVSRIKESEIILNQAKKYNLIQRLHVDEFVDLEVDNLIPSLKSSF